MNSKIKAFWWQGSGNNFGDVISPKILNRMTGLEVQFSNEEGTLCSIGSIALMKYPNKMKFWGSGVISKTEQSNANIHEYYSIRGPLSRKKIIESGGECPEIYGDPGLLIPYLFSIPDVEKIYNLSFFPHYVDYNKAKEMIKETKFGLINILGETEDIIKQVLASKFVICSSLHALILVESLGIPCCLVKLSDKLVGGMFKFEDYYNSTNRDLIYIDNSKDANLKISEYETAWYKTPQMEIDLKPMLDQFPFEIKNKKILEKFYGI